MEKKGMNKSNAEFAIRTMNEKAREFYANSTFEILEKDGKFFEFEMNCFIAEYADAKELEEALTERALQMENED